MCVLSASLQCFVLANLPLQNTTRRMTGESETKNSKLWKLPVSRGFVPVLGVLDGCWLGFLF